MTTPSLVSEEKQQDNAKLVKCYAQVVNRFYPMFAPLFHVPEEITEDQYVALLHALEDALAAVSAARKHAMASNALDQ